jgi:hypothetical protein
MVDDPIDEALALDSDTVTGRRRPGRQNHVSPALLPLLREPVGYNLSDLESDEDPDQLSVVRGIYFAMLVSLPIWILIGITMIMLI